MPDANKLAALRAAGFRVLPVCHLCDHSRFSSAETSWGTCEIILYAHAKHTGELRKASIHRAGTCPRFVAEDPDLDDSGFSEFLRPRV